MTGACVIDLEERLAAVAPMLGPTYGPTGVNATGDPSHIRSHVLLRRNWVCQPDQVAGMTRDGHRSPELPRVGATGLNEAAGDTRG